MQKWERITFAYAQGKYKLLCAFSHEKRQARTGYTNKCFKYNQWSLKEHFYLQLKLRLH